jgi:hypothetical protein
LNPTGFTSQTPAPAGREAVYRSIANMVEVMIRDYLPRERRHHS